MTTTPPPSLRDLGYLLDSEVAEVIRKAPNTLRNWRARGMGPPYAKVDGDLIVYPIAGLKKWIADRTVTPTAPPTLAKPGTKRRSK